VIAGLAKRTSVFLQAGLEASAEGAVRVGGLLAHRGEPHELDHSGDIAERDVFGGDLLGGARSCGNCPALRRARRCGSRRAGKPLLRTCRRSLGSAGKGSFAAVASCTNAAVAASSKIDVRSPTRMIGPAPIAQPGAFSELVSSETIVRSFGTRPDFAS
jgi:hypothetical protein